MPPAPKPSDYAQVVRAHHTRTMGIIVADSGLCLDIQKKEVERVRRALRPLKSADLPSLDLPASWLIAVLLCPGDTTKALAEWAGGLNGEDADRIRFYHHPRCDLVHALAPWYAAGLDDARADEVHDFASFHKLFGNDLNDRIYADAKAER